MCHLSFQNLREKRDVRLILKEILLIGETMFSPEPSIEHSNSQESAQDVTTGYSHSLTLPRRAAQEEKTKTPRAEVIALSGLAAWIFKRLFKADE